MRRALAIQFEGFDWDDGNWPKCGKHGLGRMEIEAIVRNAVVQVRDPNPDEARTRLVGYNGAGRAAFVVVTFRRIGSRRLVRPISARYMHAKEVDEYEQHQP